MHAIISLTSRIMARGTRKWPGWSIGAPEGKLLIVPSDILPTFLPTCLVAGILAASSEIFRRRACEIWHLFVYTFLEPQQLPMSPFLRQVNDAVRMRHHTKNTTTKFWAESWEYRGPSDTDSLQSFRRFLPTSFRPPSDIAVFLKALAFLPTSFRNRIIFKDAQWKTWIVP